MSLSCEPPVAIKILVDNGISSDDYDVQVNMLLCTATGNHYTECHCIGLLSVALSIGLALYAPRLEGGQIVDPKEATATISLDKNLHWGFNTSTYSIFRNDQNDGNDSEIGVIVCRVIQA